MACSEEICLNDVMPEQLHSYLWSFESTEQYECEAVEITDKNTKQIRILSANS